MIAIPDVTEAHENAGAGDRTLRTWLPADPPNWDPHTGVDDWSMRVHAALYEGLVSPGPTGELRPALARDWEVDPSGRVVTVHLRRGARWSDGREVEANDVVYTFARGTDPELKMRSAWQMYVLSGARERHQGAPGAVLDIAAPDRYTVRVVLEQPVPYMQELWALPAFAPLREDAPPTRDPVSILGVPSSGPFRYRSIEPGLSIELERNPQYWDAPSMPGSAVRIVIGGDPVQLFSEGKIDLAPLEIRALDEVDPVDVARVPEATVSYLVMNTRDEMLSSPRVREAIAAAVDPEELVTDTRSGAAPTHRLVPPSKGTRNYLEASPSVTRHRGTTMRLDGMRLGLVCTDLPDSIAEAERMADQVRKRTGAVVEVDPRSYAGHYTAIREGNYQLSIAAWRADYDDPVAFLAEHVSDGVAGNQSKWSSPRFNELMSNARGKVEAAARHGSMAEAEQLLLDHNAVVPLYSWSGLWLHRPGTRGVVHRGAGASPDLRWAVAR
ncbi:peptide ABC transporter substrate-binding protein [Nocardiopsis salina]|uniref:peptide ABC transporter substrate-binding protein n=1 Tax=Nocardiopsis salina TaxID=245836 RepID=UPI000345181F|nr:peptide ABC transporter substrate-binding protein [Nocardiopsis salina]